MQAILGLLIFTILIGLIRPFSRLRSTRQNTSVLIYFITFITLLTEGSQISIAKTSNEILKEKSVEEEQTPNKKFSDEELENLSVEDLEKALKIATEEAEKAEYEVTKANRGSRKN